ncbi:d -box splicing factor-binding site protein [Cystoisospora suis]|uniref:D-box splicing factor-binding site protein n=1 Tax=Cystoisospora suis TaxID=483139 RepID=A0A2C6LC56_9APIC|nr:d -box splicing factor-binding site protein [Cystoisospora suis]
MMHVQQGSSTAPHVRDERTAPAVVNESAELNRGDVAKVSGDAATAPKKFSFSFGKKASSSALPSCSASASTSISGIPTSSSTVSGTRSRATFSFSLSTRPRPSGLPVRGGIGGVPSSSRSLSTNTPGAGIFDIEGEKQVPVQQVLSISKDGGWETQGGEEEKAPLVIPCLNRLTKPPTVSKPTYSFASAGDQVNGSSKEKHTSEREADTVASEDDRSWRGSSFTNEKKLKRHEPNYLKLDNLKEEAELPVVKPEMHNGAETRDSKEGEHGRSSNQGESSEPFSQTELKGYGLILQSKSPPSVVSVKVKSEPPYSSAPSASSTSLDELAAQALIAEARGEATTDSSISQTILPILSRNEKLAELRRKHRERLQQHHSLPGSSQSSFTEGNSNNNPPSRSSSVRGRGSVFYVKESSSSVKSEEDSYDDRELGGERDRPRPEVFFSREQSEKELLKEELKLLPDAPSTTSSAYSTIPISEFGLAMLRGMGYDPEKQSKSFLPKERKKRVYNRAGLGSEEEIEKLWVARQNKLREEAAQKKKQKMEEMVRSRRG